MWRLWRCLHFFWYILLSNLYLITLWLVVSRAKPSCIERIPITVSLMINPVIAISWISCGKGLKTGSLSSNLGAFPAITSMLFWILIHFLTSKPHPTSPILTFYGFTLHSVELWCIFTLLMFTAVHTSWNQVHWEAPSPHAPSCRSTSSSESSIEQSCYLLANAEKY